MRDVKLAGEPFHNSFFGIFTPSGRSEISPRAAPSSIILLPAKIERLPMVQFSPIVIGARCSIPPSTQEAFTLLSLPIVEPAPIESKSKAVRSTESKYTPLPTFAPIKR